MHEAGNDEHQRKVEKVHPHAIGRHNRIKLTRKQGCQQAHESQEKACRDQTGAPGELLGRQDIDGNDNGIARDQEQIAPTRHHPFSQSALENEQDHISPEQPSD